MNSREKKLGLIIRSVVGIILLVILLRYVDTGELFHSLKRASLSYLLLAVGYQYASVLLGSLNQYLLFKPVLRVSLRSFLLPYFRAFATGLLLPGQLGDASIVLFLKSKGSDYSQSLSIYLLDKYITLFFYLAIVLTFILEIMEYPRFFAVALSMLLGVISALLFYLVPVISPARPTRKWAWRVAGFVKNTVSQLFSYAKEYPFRLLLNTLLTGLKIFFVMNAYHAILISLGYSLSLWDVGVSSIASGIVAYIPVSVHGVGTVEATALWVFGRLSVSSADVLSSFLILRASGYVLVIFFLCMVLFADHGFIEKRGNGVEL
jgi:uncharacterized membrane protein YbhN (UPF0104 family)